MRKLSYIGALIAAFLSSAAPAQTLQQPYLNITGINQLDGVTINGTTPAPGSFTTINVTGSTPIPANGIYLPAANNLGVSARSLLSAEFTNPASAVDYFVFSGQTSAQATNLGVFAVPGGTDTNVGMAFGTKGTGAIAFYTNTTSDPVLYMPDTASSVDYVQITGVATGGAATGPAIAAAGSDPNIGLTVQGHGTGIVRLGQTICTAAGSSAQTCNGQRGIVTTNSLSTAGATAATFTVTNSSVTTSSLVLCTNQGYSGTYVTNGYPIITECKPGNGSFIATIVNTHATNALSGTLQIGFIVLN